MLSQPTGEERGRPDSTETRQVDAPGVALPALRPVQLFPWLVSICAFSSHQPQLGVEQLSGNSGPGRLSSQSGLLADVLSDLTMM